MTRLQSIVLGAVILIWPLVVVWGSVYCARLFGIENNPGECFALIISDIWLVVPLEGFLINYLIDHGDF